MRLPRFLGRALLVLIPFAILVDSGRIGIDFGVHWDEHLQFRLVARTIKTGVLVPGVYNYPTVPYWLALSTIAPKILQIPKDIRPGDLLEDLSTLRNLEQEDTSELQKYALDDPAYHLRTRLVFLVVSALAVIWVYLLVWQWRRRPVEAFVAAALLGLSWEFAYQARWIAPDVIMTSFTALTMMLVIAGTARTNRRVCIYGAAIAGGIATATKYQCGLLLLPVLAGAWMTLPHPRPRWAFVKLGAGVLALFVVAFVFCMPGAVLDSTRFIRWLKYVIITYKDGGHGGYDLPPGLPYARKMLVYLGSVFFSHYLPIAAAVTVFMAVGTYALVRESRSRAFLFLCFPALYFAYMSTQSVLIVRNIVVLAPFLAILAARGVGFTFARLPRRWLRGALAGVVAVGLAINAVWLYRAAWSIRDATPHDALIDFADYVSAQPPQSVFASTTVRQDMSKQGLDLTRLAKKIEDARELAFYPNDWATFWTRPVNLPRVSKTWFGPWEVNFDWYTTWVGFQRIVLVSAKDEAWPAGRVKLNPETLAPL